MKLTKEEEYALVTSYVADGNQQALDTIIDSQMGVIVNTAKRFTYNNGELEDLIQEGVIATMKALASFDMSKGLRLSTYIAIAAWSEMNRYLKRQWRLGSNYIELVPEEDLMNEVDGNINSNTQVYVVWLDLQNRIEEYLSNIPEVQKESFLAYSFEKETAKDVMKKHSISQNWVFLLAKKSKNELKKLLCLEE